MSYLKRIHVARCYDINFYSYLNWLDALSATLHTTIPEIKYNNNNENTNETKVILENIIISKTKFTTTANAIPFFGSFHNSFENFPQLENGHLHFIAS